MEHITLTHRLATADTLSSTRSSATDLAELAASDEHFALSLDISDISCKLDAADSETNHLIRNAFGSNSSPESKVRGVAMALQWQTIGLHCLAPGEKVEEKSQLVQMRSAEFYGVSTWRPQGWSRNELLFDSDPNLALVVCSGSVASLDVACDVQLLQALANAAEKSRPQKPRPTSQEPRKEIPLVPRIRFRFDLGHVMIVLADGVSEEKTTLTLASDGLHVGCFTSFSDIVARRRDMPSSRRAFEKEAELQGRRESSGSRSNYTLPESCLDADLRRDTTDPAILRDDYAVSMRIDGRLALEPLSLHMALSGKARQHQETYHLASIGRLHGTLTGDILGKENYKDDGSVITTIDPTSLSCLLDLGVDQGIKLNLWRTQVINALMVMTEAHTSERKEKPHTERANVLARLPSGISARVSLGQISAFIGHEDPNPQCTLGLIRGLWIRSTVIFEYAYYNSKAQALQTRHGHNSVVRTKLKLPEDITTQALAFYNALESAEGCAALASFTCLHTCVIPVYNGEKFSKAGGTSLSHHPVPTRPKEAPRDSYVGWEFRRPREEDSLASGRFANNVENIEVGGDAVQASRPLVLVPHMAVNWLIKRSARDSEVEHSLTGRVGTVSINCDMSHIYAALMAIMTITRITKSRKKANHPKQPSKLSAIALEFTIPTIKAHIQFPLHEHLFLYLDGVNVSKPPCAGFAGGANKIYAFVPSVRSRGEWEELGRIKALSVQSAPIGEAPVFGIHTEAFRLRIPVFYTFSKLVLNISSTVKTLKLLSIDLKQPMFETVKRPVSEEPKRLPPIAISFDHISLEARDDPVETELGLIWRSGAAEQVNRIELEDAYDQKLYIVSMLKERGHSPSEIEPPFGLSKLSTKATVDIEEARIRLDWYITRCWTKRIRLAKQEQRRKQRNYRRQFDAANLTGVTLPIKVTESTYTAPLFRAAIQRCKLVVSDLGWSRDEIIKYMGDVSTPFSDDAKFDLMLPLRLKWEMGEGSCTLRDYPLPLLRIPPAADQKKPAWHLDTPFIVAEELPEECSLTYIPVEVIPSGLGAIEASPFTVQIAKNALPVKTYSRPVVDITSNGVTEFAWGNSYQPAIQDFMRVMDSITHPPRDPSPKPGFWDKFRLILHWKVTVNFENPVHLHMKGTYDPYCVVGHGAGFAWVWRGGTKLEINQPNEQHEVIQITAQELLVAIPE